MSCVSKIAYTLLSLYALCLGATSALASDKEVTCIITPKIESSYKYVFDEMIGGTNSQLPHLRRIEINGGSKESIQSTLAKCRNTTSIVLGKKAWGYAHKAGLNNLVVGAVKSTQNSIAKPKALLSYQIDPALFLTTLKKFTPTITQIHIIDTPSVPQGDKRAALLSQATNLNLNITVHAASGYKERAKAYQQVVKGLNPKREALWIWDKGKKFTPVFKWILEESWKRNIVLLSNNLGHVKRGALFTLYPDNHAYGVSLAKAALDILKAPTEEALDQATNTNTNTNNKNKSKDDIEVENKVEVAEEGVKSVEGTKGAVGVEEGVKIKVDVEYMRQTKLAVNKIALKHIFGPDYPIRRLDPDLILPYSN